MLKNMRSTLLVASTLALVGGIGMAVAQVQPGQPPGSSYQDQGIREDCGTLGEPASKLTRQAAPSEAAREAARSRAQAPAAGKGTVGAAVEPIHPGDNPAQDRNCNDD
jgi:hypothetical protein